MGTGVDKGETFSALQSPHLQEQPQREEHSGEPPSRRTEGMDTLGPGIDFLAHAPVGEDVDTVVIAEVSGMLELCSVGLAPDLGTQKSERLHLWLTTHFDGAPRENRRRRPLLSEPV